MADYYREIDPKTLWQEIAKQAKVASEEFPLIASFMQRNILNHQSFREALSYVLAEKLAEYSESNEGVSQSNIQHWYSFILEVLERDLTIERSALADLTCQLESNASIKDFYTPLLYFGAYQALQSYRIAHYCWCNEKQPIASYIQSRVVSLFGVDIHPAASIGKGIFIDHAVGIVIGETAVVEDNVTLFQNVTLGGTGKEAGDRHPKVRKGAFIGAGAQIFGNIEIGENCKIGGGSVIVKSVESGVTMLPTAAKKYEKKQSK